MSVLDKKWTPELSQRVDRIIDYEHKKADLKMERENCRHIYGSYKGAPVWVENIKEVFLSDDFEEDDKCRKCGQNLWKI